MTHPLAMFDRIYVINLPSRADRRAEMEAQLRRIGLSLASERVRLFEAVRPVDAAGFPSVGARGCFLSHLGVLRHAAEARLETIAVFEDDLNFADHFVVGGAAVLVQLQQEDWSVFYGGHAPIVPRPGSSGCISLAPTQAVQNLHFVAFKGAAIAALAQYLAAMLERAPGSPEGGPMHVDGACSWFRRSHPQYRAYAAEPELGYQRASRTDIHALRWPDRVPLVRDAVVAWRRMKNR